MVGIGALVAATPEAPASASASAYGDIKLVSDTCDTTLKGGCDSAGGAGNSAALALSPVNLAALSQIVTLGGWLIGDGENAKPGCEGSACNGGNAGLLFGDGGQGGGDNEAHLVGYDGGAGGLAGFFGGDGGNGGDAASDYRTAYGGWGGDGGRAPLGKAGNGGNGGGGGTGASGNDGTPAGDA